MIHPLPGKLEETYTILQKLHEGKNSTVYLARHNRLHNLWAIKQVVRGSAAEQDALREFQILQSLRHPKLPFVSGITEDAYSICLIEEFIEGASLEADLKDHQGRSAQEREKLAIALGTELCDILSYLHSRKPPVIHRDLKPANIMLLPDGGIKLLDFGIAVRLPQESSSGYRRSSSSDDPGTFTSGVTRTLTSGDGNANGTPGYAAPEQLSSGTADVRADIYSLGATLYEIASGKNPAETPYALGPLRKKGNPDASEGLEYIVTKCTNVDPARRYSSVEEVLHDLQNVDHLHPNQKDEGPKERRQEKKTKRTPLILLLVAVLCLAAGVLAYTGIRKSRDLGLPGTEVSDMDNDATNAAAADADKDESNIAVTDGGTDNIYALIEHGDKCLEEAEKTMTSHILSENDLIQRMQYYQTAREDYTKAAEGGGEELAGEELESRMEVLSVLLDEAAIDEEVLGVMQDLADSFDRNDLTEVCSLIRQSDAARTSYCNIHRVQSILYPVGDRAVIAGWPWTYYGEIENEAPSGEGIAVNQDRMMQISLEAHWENGTAQEEAVEEAVNLSPTSASGNFVVTRSRSGMMHDGVMDGDVRETLTYKISEEDSEGRITDFVTDPFEIVYTLDDGAPVPLDKSSLPDDVNWRNEERLASEDLYAWSEETGLLFYVGDYQSYTYKVQAP